MSTTSTQNNVVGDAEIAAGGIVWADEAKRTRICIVHRTQHQDWTLPKGRSQPKEKIEETARRGVTEETGAEVWLRAFAGTYSYAKDGTPKVVLVWHMTLSSTVDKESASKEEILEARWLSPKEAYQMLSHQSERDFVARHCLGERPEGLSKYTKSEPERGRLGIAIRTVRERFRGYISQSGENASSWWADSAVRSLEAAETALLRDDVDAGWGGVHDAERFMVFGMSREELVTKAATLNAEGQAKLKGWRESAVKELFGPTTLREWLKKPSSILDGDIALLRHVVVQSLAVLHSHSDNTYYRMHLVAKQLGRLVLMCGVLLVAAFALSYWYAPETDMSFGNLISVALAGALGGVVSAMYQLSRVGQARIPEALLHGLITSGRPLVGAAAALFIYIVLKSDVISLVESSNITFLSGLVVAFVAGFSEKFVLSTVAKVAGTEKDESAQ